MAAQNACCSAGLRPLCAAQVDAAGLMPACPAAVLFFHPVCDDRYSNKTALFKQQGVWFMDEDSECRAWEGMGRATPGRGVGSALCGQPGALELGYWRCCRSMLPLASGRAMRHSGRGQGRHG